MSLVLGVDDAGRGPLIGPMILAGVLLNKNQEAHLKDKGVADSKLLSHPKRIELGKEIKENSLKSYVVIATPNEIDASITSGINLNTLEAMKIAKVINNLNIKNKKIKVIVDCPSVNTKTWRLKLLEFIEHIDNLEVLCEHKADFNHPSVSAASILAKVQREEEVAKLKKIYGEIGSGYPSDPYTIKFLKEQGNKFKDAGIFRKSWATWKALFPEKSQANLGDF
ncbi:ribonuclease HII [Candidatus Pacearchaeota archaeon]|nr:ribonuclease HII [Candidatus Pacearchaeota archaeon]